MDIPNDKFILDENGNPVEEPDLMKWAEWIESFNRQIAEDIIGDIRVSTVFLGLNHRLFGEGPPILFETMTFSVENEEKEIFGHKYFGSKELDEILQFQERYSTKNQAIEGHNKTVVLIKSLLNYVKKTTE